MTLTVLVTEKSGFVYVSDNRMHPDIDMESSVPAILSLLIFTPFKNVNSLDSHASQFLEILILNMSDNSIP